MRQPLQLTFKNKADFLNQIERFSKLEPEVDYYLKISCKLLYLLLNEKEDNK